MFSIRNNSAGCFFANLASDVRLTAAARVIKPQSTEFSTAFVDKRESGFRVRC
jgi:hypothetical protein